MTEFTHLHLHTEYSLLESMVRVKPLITKMKELGMSAVAITDRGNLFGALEFYFALQSAGLKPLVGMEAYVAPGDRQEKKASSKFHAYRLLILLCKNLKGYENLMFLSSQAYEDGFYYVPRIDRALIEQYHEGLIAISPFYGGPIGRHIRNGDNDKAMEEAKWYQGIFKDDFYLGLQENQLPDQEKLTATLLSISEKTGIKPVATNEVYYLDKNGSEAHEILYCIKEKKALDDPHFKLSSDTFYIRSGEEMAALFKHCPQAISNTKEIEHKCDLKLVYDEYHAPQFSIPSGMTEADYLRRLSKKGLEDRLEILREVYGSEVYSPEKIEAYEKRLVYELDMIIQMGFPGYFLIVNDFINWAKKNGVPVGPGRGSAAGSLVAYALRITDIDPIPYGLLFERFLNPERVSMPDIDVDFCQDNRWKVLDYVSEKYGTDKVAHITTFGRMKAKAALRDVGRVLGMTYSAVDIIAKMVPNDLSITLEKALKVEPKFNELMEKDPQVEKLIRISRQLEGLGRHASTHACGVVISKRPIVEHVPIYRDKENQVVTQFEGKWVEKTGLIKFDFLGLKNLTAIQRTVELVRAGPDPNFDIEKTTLEQKEVYKLLGSGNTTGVFQLESSGMRQLLKKLKPSRFEDCIALVALYRPGPLGSGMVDDFVDRKHGRKKVTYPLPQLSDVLGDTYGVILYQEQVQKIAVVLANYSLGEADLLRRAMGKKKPEEMAQQKDRFLQGAHANKIDGKKAEEIFDLMAKFAEYGFNKSHSAAYGYIAYITAYLKSFFPVEFLAACLTCDMENTSKIMGYLHNCSEMGIEVLSPDINHSMKDFSVEDGKIRFGFGGIKNVGDAAIEAILESRSKAGKKESIYDFCETVDLRRVNKRVLENLIKAGCFDSLHSCRAAIYSVIGRSMDLAERKQADCQSGQNNLFDLFNQGSVGDSDFEEHLIPEIEEWPMKEKLKYELETMGRYMTGHPLDRYKQLLSTFCSHSMLALEEIKDNSDVVFGGVINDLRQAMSKKGDKMAFFNLEDCFGRVEVCVFPKIFPLVEEFLASDDPIYVKGRFQIERGDDGEVRQTKIVSSEIGSLVELQERETNLVRLTIDSGNLDMVRLDDLHQDLTHYTGVCKLEFQVTFSAKDCVILRPEANYGVTPTEALMVDISKKYNPGITIEYLKV